MKTRDYSGERAYTPDIASSYEEDRKVEKMWGVEQDYMQRAVLQMPEGSSLLDIPVGTGRFFQHYEARKLSVLGMDISPSMLEEAAGKTASPAISLELGDARALSKGNNSFDYVVCWRMLHLLPPDVLRTVIGELSRVASKRLFLQAYVRDRWHRLLWLRMRMAQTLGLKERSSAAGARWSHIESYAHSEAMLLEAFSDCGLSLSSIDVLGSYGALRVKVYVLSKA